MITVTMFYRDPCQECEQVEEDLKALQDIVPNQLIRINVNEDRSLQEKYNGRLPVIEVGPYRLQSPLARQDLRVMLSAAQDRIQQLERVDYEAYQHRRLKGQSISSSDRITHWLSHHYLALVNFLLFLYVGLPFLAPVLLKNSATLPATIIYKVYSPLCHQLAFRSWFLFGQQAFYPRELANIPDVVPYEVLQDSNEIDILAARNFNGNEVVGYKVALCQRDIAIYAAMLLFGLVYSVTNRKIPAVPWWAWIGLGLIPIGIDGFSQLSSVAGNIPAWIPVRESNPILRTITGGLFGWMTAWYLFPMLEETARETRLIVQRKMAYIRQSGGSMDRS